MICWGPKIQQRAVETGPEDSSGSRELAEVDL